MTTPHPKSHDRLRRERAGTTVRAESDRRYEERRAADPRLARAKRIRSSARWRKVRALQLKREPRCEDCLERGDVQEAAEVHHMKPLVDHPELAFVPANLRSLCSACHNRRERHGRGE